MVEINANEYAAIIFHILEDCRDWEQIYKIAKGPKSLNKVTEDSKNTLVYRWKNRPEIKKAFKEIRDIYETRKEEFIKEILTKGETEPIKAKEPAPEPENTNFLDRDEFLKFLNDRANKIKDDKLRNEILKMLSDNLRYKDSDQNEIHEIQRFYTPVMCETCEIYNKCKDCNISFCPAAAK